MEKEYSLADGKALISLARKSISYALASRARLQETTDKKRFLENRGCFVTLNTFPEKELRGCIGLPYPVSALWNAIIDAAASAAFRDPRFSPMQASELDKVVLEVSILTLPKEIKGKKKDLAEKIECGEDGIIIQKGERSGLLLPQVATEYNWDAETFLDHCCQKAMLPKSAWRQADCAVFKFQAQIFSEKAPDGEVEEH
tara:strand:+ start:886 stop:1485 length:600 start_codon:yes stop_codon:yes gene_type:complete